MKKNFILLLVTGLIFSSFTHKIFAATDALDFLGAYEPYEQFNEKSQHYVHVSPADKLAALTLEKGQLTVWRHAL